MRTFAAPVIAITRQPAFRILLRDDHRVVDGHLRFFAALISKASAEESYVVTTGTGSGKSLAFFVPIIDRILREKSGSPSD